MPPEVPEGYALWLDNFWELSTDRPMLDMGIGPIPSGSIRDFTRGWDPQEAEDFRVFIRGLDAAFLSASNGTLQYEPIAETKEEQSGGDSPRPNRARDHFRKRFKE